MTHTIYDTKLVSDEFLAKQKVIAQDILADPEEFSRASAWFPELAEQNPLRLTLLLESAKVKYFEIVKREIQMFYLRTSDQWKPHSSNMVRDGQFWSRLREERYIDTWNGWGDPSSFPNEPWKSHDLCITISSIQLYPNGEVKEGSYLETWFFGHKFDQLSPYRYQGNLSRTNDRYPHLDVENACFLPPKASR